MGDLTGRVAVVTGASRRQGIGAAICRALAARGADIFFTYWHTYDRDMAWGADEDYPAELEAKLRRMGVRCERMEADLADPETPVRVIDSAGSQLGDVGILVNNATHSTRDGYEALDAATLDAHYAVNVRAPVLLSAEFARRFTMPSGGRIINMASGPSLGPMPHEIAYATTKAAIEAFTRTLAVEVAPRGITVNAVNPGPTDSGWMTQELKREIVERFPMGRIGRPEDAARLVAFLASDDAAWITGQVIHSEGGFIR